MPSGAWERAIDATKRQTGTVLGDTTPMTPTSRGRATSSSPHPRRRRVRRAETSFSSRHPARDGRRSRSRGESSTRRGRGRPSTRWLLRAPEVYASLLEVALRRAGIPAWFARGTSRPDPSGRAFLALVDCALEGLSARRFAEYLSLGQVPPLDEAGAPPVDRAVWMAPADR